MAPEDPLEVTAILEQLKTDNWTVARTVVDAVKALPPQNAAALVPTMIGWVKSGLLWHDLADIAQVCAKLATGGQPDAAVELLTGAFKLNWKDGQLNRRDEYWYIHEMKETIIPALVEVRAMSLIQHLASELLLGIGAESHSGEIDPSDSYEIWRPAIEDHPQNAELNVSSKLICCLVSQHIELIAFHGTHHFCGKVDRGDGATCCC